MSRNDSSIRRRTRYEGVYQRPLGQSDRTFYYCRNVDGKKIWVNVGRASDGFTAEDARRARAEALVRPGPAPAGATVGSLIPLFLEDARLNRSPDGYRFHESIARVHLSGLAGLRVDELTPALVRDWTLGLAEGRARSTVEKVVGALRRTVQLGIDRGLASPPNPVAGAPKAGRDEPCERWLKPREASDLVAELRRDAPDWADMAEVSLETGLRAMELYRLRGEDVDDEGLVATVVGKSGRREVVHLTDRALAVIRSRTPGAGTVFPRQPHDHPFRRAVKRLGLNDAGAPVRLRVRFHTLRHTFATSLVRAGVDMLLVQRLMRHRSPVMTQRYAHHASEDLKAALRRRG